MGSAWGGVTLKHKTEQSEPPGLSRRGCPLEVLVRVELISSITCLASSQGGPCHFGGPATNLRMWRHRR